VSFFKNEHVNLITYYYKRKQLIDNGLNYYDISGTNWILPMRHLQEIISEVSLWSHQNPHACCYAPMVIQIFRSSHAGELGDRTPERHKLQPQSSQLKPYLLPETHDKFCTVWYDWFM